MHATRHSVSIETPRKCLKTIIDGTRHSTLPEEERLAGKTAASRGEHSQGIASSPFSSLRKKGEVFVGRGSSRDISLTVSFGALAPEGLEKSFSAAF